VQVGRKIDNFVQVSVLR